MFAIHHYWHAFGQLSRAKLLTGFCNRIHTDQHHTILIRQANQSPVHPHTIGIDPSGGVIRSPAPRANTLAGRIAIHLPKRVRNAIPRPILGVIGTHHIQRSRSLLIQDELIETADIVELKYGSHQDASQSGYAAQGKGQFSGKA